MVDIGSPAAAGSGSWRSLTPEARRALIGSYSGHVVEWYDFLLYGMVAATLAANFFPTGDATTALLSAFVTNGLAFVVRPIGALLAGHFGDRLGRSKTLAVTVGGMSLSTFLIGCLPGFSQIGVAAPVLLVLLRLVQGLSAGGEVGGASAVISEYVPRRRRATWLSGLAMSLATSAILAAAVVGVSQGIASPEGFAEWAWRIGFWLALPLGTVSLYLRLRLEETPAFKKVQERGEVVPVPAAVVFRKHRGRLGLLVLFFAANAVSSGVLLGFYPAFLAQGGVVPPQVLAFASIAAYLILGLAGIALGMASDRFGRRPIRVASCALLVIVAIPSLLATSSDNALVAILGPVLFAIPVAGTSVSMYPILMEMFPPEVRYSAGSISYNLSYVIFGSTTPFVVGALIAAMGTPLVAGVYVTVVAAVGVVVGLLLPETRQVDLGSEPETQAPATA